MQQTRLSARPIAVVGMAARFAAADNVGQFWANLVAGVESVDRPDEDPNGRKEMGAQPGGHSGHFVRSIARVNDIESFDADHLRITPAEATIMDPQHRVLLEVAAEALEDAGYAGQCGLVVGVFVGCGENHYLRDFVRPAEALAGRGQEVRVTLSNEKDFLAPRIAFKLGLTGPAITVQTGCATSLSAVALACSALAAADCDIALAGGVSLVMPDVDGYNYVEGGILSPDGRCRAFDASANGTVPGSGAGIVVLRRDADAIASRDYRRAVIRGWAVNNDGGSRAGFTAPNISGQESVIRAALDRASLAPDEVGYIETHGTGTAIGDPVEFEALQRVFATNGRPPRTLMLGAVKPNIGHSDAAAGIAGLIKATLVVESGTMPGTLHFREPNPDLELASTPFDITSETRAWASVGPRVAGVSSFGIGGSNAHVVLESVPISPAEATIRPRQVLALSARNDDELRRMKERLADQLESAATSGAISLADIAYTLAVGRNRFTRRWAAAVTDHAQAVAQLRAPAERERATARWSLTIAGTPDELASMGERLIATEPLMRGALLELTGQSDLAGLPAVQAGALAAVVVVRILGRLGLTFARVDAPKWARPAAHWLANGAEVATLSTALDACTASDDAGPVRDSAGQVLVGPSFDLADTVTAAWRAEVAIDWAIYYSDETRSRVPLPTYPFTRRRFWLDRPVVNPDLGVVSSPDLTLGTHGHDRMDVIESVAKAWREVLGVEHIVSDAHFVDDLGGDSMYAVEIGALLNERYGLNLPIDLPFVAPTIVAAAKYVELALATKEDG